MNDTITLPEFLEKDILNRIENERKLEISNISEDMLSVFTFLYLYHQLNEHGIVFDENISISRILQYQFVPQKLLSIVTQFAKIPSFFNAKFINSVDFLNVHSFFHNFSVSEKPNTQITSRELECFINALLDLQSGDKYCQFFTNSFFAYETQNPNRDKISFNFCQTTEKNKFFTKIKNNIVAKREEYDEENYNCFEYNIDVNCFDEINENSYSKIFANLAISSFLLQEKSFYEERTFPFTRDTIISYLRKIISSLQENGTAIILVSDSFFSRNYKEMQCELINHQLLAGVIKIPFGYVYPKNDNVSLLVLTKEKQKNGVCFVEIDDETLSYKNLNIPNLIEYCIEVRKSILNPTDSDMNPSEKGKQIFVKYQTIKEKQYDLNIYTYIFNPISYLEHLASSIMEKSDTFVLSNEADIFRGTQSIEKKDLIENQNDDNYSPRFLRISDIDSNSNILDTMPCIQKVPENCEKFRLTQNDVIISRTINPARIVIPPKNQVIYLSENMYIIRLNTKSKLSRYYLKAFLESDKGQEILQKSAQGGSLKIITRTNLAKIKIPYLDEELQRDFEMQYLSYEEEIKQLEKDLSKKRDEKRNLINKY